MKDLQRFTGTMRNLFEAAYEDFEIYEQFSDLKSHDIPASLICDYLEKDPVEFGRGLLRSISIDHYDIKNALSNLNKIDCGEVELPRDLRNTVLDDLFRHVYIEIIPKVDLEEKRITLLRARKIIHTNILNDSFEYTHIGRMAEQFPKNVDRIFFSYEEKGASGPRDYGFTTIAERTDGRFSYPRFGGCTAPTFLFSFYGSNPMYHMRLIDNVTREFERL